MITYFSDHPAPTFKAIEELDPAGVAGEIRARASAAGHPRPTEAALASARAEIAKEYEESTAMAIGLVML
jgi:hypothetical protein